jgi:lysophospholipase L1-like esterase
LAASFGSRRDRSGQEVTPARRGRRYAVALSAALLVAVLLVSAVVVLGGRSGALPVRPPEHYVALGDSYAAGPGIAAATGVPLTCGRSTANYPSLVRDGVVATTFQDVSCAGATTANLTAPQHTEGGTSPPQLDALTNDTTLVTLTLGGNDIGFTEIVDRCLARDANQPTGAPCRASYQRAGRDLLAARIAATAPKLAEGLRLIGQRAPSARVLVVGYPTILPTDGGCSQAPFSAGDIGYLNETFQALNAMIEQQARAEGARYVDTARDSVGHDVCAPPDRRWVEGRAPSPPAAAFHPNALGMRATARQVLDALLPP